MATAQVRQLNERYNEPVFIIGRANRPQWSEVFNGNPRLTRTTAIRHRVLVNGAGHRPYIKAKTDERWIWQKWEKEPGEIFLSKDEKMFGERYRGAVIVEPNTKVSGGNKAWIWDRWQEVVDAFPGQRFFQVGVAGSQILRGTTFVLTSIRQAFAILSTSRAFVGTEGGLHHAAAAFGIPAVVLFSEFISPDITGYELHRNLRHANGTCGARLPCEGCRKSMDAISVDEVVHNLREVLT